MYRLIHILVIKINSKHNIMGLLVKNCQQSPLGHSILSPDVGTKSLWENWSDNQCFTEQCRICLFTMLTESMYFACAIAEGVQSDLT